jgi:two-component system, OmpR family, response regulator MprA
VLVVEDDDATRTIVADLLDDEGYRVRAAGEGAAALEILRSWRPDLIVLDVVMPGMDAPVFRARKVGLPGAADVPVLLSSATRPADLARIGRDLGTAEAVVEPFDADALLATVARPTGGPS